MYSVSIVIPIFNVEKHIERCLRSVMRQDYVGPIECLLINDSTPDASMQIVGSLLKDYKGPIAFKIFHHNVNKGLSATRNTGTRNATGDYIFYLDSDDEIMPHAISTLVSLVDKYPKVDIVYGDWYVSKDFNLLQNRRGLPEYTDNRKKICKLLLRSDVTMTAQNKLIKREYILKENLFFYEGILHEDVHLNYYYATTANSIAISYVPTYVYYLNPNGITGAFSHKNIESIWCLVNEILSNKRTCFLQYKLCYSFQYIYSSYLKCSEKADLCKTKKFLKRIGKEALSSGVLLLYIYIQILLLIPSRLWFRIRKTLFTKGCYFLLTRYYYSL